MRNILMGAAALTLAACSGGESTQTETLTSGTDAKSTSITVFAGGTIHTGMAGAPTSEAVVVDRAGKIIAIAPPSSKDWDESDTQIIDLKGGHLYPGFVDGHAHLIGIGFRELSFNLEGTASIDELVTHLEAQIWERPEGKPLYGRGWIETGWPSGRMPTTANLDPVSPDHAVILERADGHAVVVNTAALTAAGITNETPDPAGGKIERDEDGKATGMLIDNAANLVTHLIAEPTEADIAQAYEVGAKLYASRGWTGLHNMSTDPEHAELLAKLDSEGKLPVRIHNAFDNGENNAGMKIASERAHETDTITNRGVKLYMDGALGSRGAQLLEPYSDRPETSGLSLTSDKDLTTFMASAKSSNVQLAIHAIGDLANRRIIQAFEAGAYGNNLRWRIEHTQILAAEDVERMAKSGLIASMQPSHAIGDLHFAPDRLGMDRLTGAYAWRDILDAGGVIVGGSDAPVEVGSPLVEFYGAVSRTDLSGFSGEGWHPEQAVTRDEALTMFTAAPAFASFQEAELGTLEVGKLADFTVFDRDLLSIPEADILKAEVVMTVVGGQVVYNAD